MAVSGSRWLDDAAKDKKDITPIVSNVRASPIGIVVRVPCRLRNRVFPGMVD